MEKPDPLILELRFPAPGCAGTRLCSTAKFERTTPLAQLAALDLPIRGRWVACGSYTGLGGRRSVSINRKNVEANVNRDNDLEIF